MANTKLGAAKIAAKKIGITLEEYVVHKEAGDKWCTKCKQWKNIQAFGKDTNRGDGLTACCFDCRHVKERKQATPPSFKGRQHTETTKRMLSEIRIGNTNKKTGEHPWSKEQKKAHSDLFRQIAKKGADNPNWKGGVTPENERIRASVEYKDWRLAVFHRDRYTCQMCGDSKGGNLNAHHIKSFADYPDLRLEVSNGVTLCKLCHKDHHRGR